MKMINNCRMEDYDCLFLKWPMFHSGYTGKSGEETWFYCKRTRRPIRHIKKCDLQGNVDAQRDAYLGHIPPTKRRIPWKERQ
jgi:hypothetical protein